MEIVISLAQLRAGRQYWVPAVVSPMRDWPGARGCRRGGRFLIAADGLHPALTGFPAFTTRAECLRWIMEHRARLAETAPGAPIAAVRLDAWMLGLV